MYISATEKTTDSISISISSSAKQRRLYWQQFYLPHKVLVFKGMSR